MPVRHSDIQAFLVEALIRSNQFSDGLSALRDLAQKAPDWSTRVLIEKQLIERLAQECGIDFDVIWNSGKRTNQINDNNGTEPDEDEIQEVMD